MNNIVLSSSRGNINNSYSAINDSSQFVSYHNISYTIKKNIFLCRKKKTVLRDVCGVMHSGLNAIMGPTGSGKTTLMDILADRKDKRCLTGRVFMNGTTPSSLKHMTGYVTQDIFLQDMITVRESIFFSANLRLPRSISYKEKRNRVQGVIDCLGLTKVSESRIGNCFMRGISGGELRRTHIAMELVISPSILFLDEPTSGLDAYTSVELIKTLKNLCKEGRLIVVAIHQPRYAIYQLFDTITLLSQGHTVYHGSAKSALEYFSLQGYPCPDRENPADFFLDTIARDEIKHQDYSRDDNGWSQIAQSPLPLHSLYEKSALNSRLQNNLVSICSSISLLHSSNHKHKGYSVNFLWQLYFIGIRSTKFLFRSPAEFILMFLSSHLMSIIIGIIYWNLDLSFEGLQNRVGAMFLDVVLVLSLNLACIETFQRSKLLFIHENSHGYYRVSSFLISNVFLDIMVKRIATTTTSTIIWYYMIGLKSNISNLSIFLLVQLITIICSATLQFLLSSYTNSFAVALILSGFTYVIMMVFGGLLVNLTSLTVWLQWLQYLSFYRLSLSSMLINELVGLDFCYDFFRTITPDGSCFNTSFNLAGKTLSSIQTGEDYLTSQGIPYSEPFDQWSGIVGLFGYTAVLILLTYVSLRLLRKGN